mgnify:CR=1 FL=1
MSNNVIYPRQIFKSARSTKTLGVDMFLSSNCLNPLELHDEFSRFTITILEKVGDKYNSFAANINPKEVPYIYEMTLKNIGSKDRSDTDEGKPLSIAYTKTFAFGNLKGKSPAAVLKSQGGYEALKSQRQFLMDGLSKFRGNQEMIDAIDEAFRLLESGELKDSPIQEASTVSGVIFDSEFRPKRNSMDADGFYKVRRLLITLEPTLNNPYKISIETMKAPIETNPGGLNKILIGQGKEKLSGTIYMTEKEFFQMVDKMDKTLKYYEQMVFNSAFAKAVELDRQQSEGHAM